MTSIIKWGFGHPDILYYLGIQAFYNEPQSSIVPDIFYIDLNAFDIATIGDLDSSLLGQLETCRSQNKPIVGVIRSEVLSLDIYDSFKSFLNSVLILGELNLAPEYFHSECERLSIQIISSKKVFDMKRFIRFEDKSSSNRDSRELMSVDADPVPIFVNPPLDMLERLWLTFGPLMQTWIFLFVNHQVKPQFFSKKNIKNFAMDISLQQTREIVDCVSNGVVILSSEERTIAPAPGGLLIELVMDSSPRPVVRLSPTVLAFEFWASVKRFSDPIYYQKAVDSQIRKAILESSIYSNYDRNISLIVSSYRADLFSSIVRKIECWIECNPSVTFCEVLIGCHGYSCTSEFRDSLLNGISIKAFEYKRDVFVGHILQDLTNKASAECVIKFDDDDFYSPTYPTDIAIGIYDLGFAAFGSRPSMFLQDQELFFRRTSVDYVCASASDYLVSGTNLVSGSTLSINKKTLEGCSYRHFKGASDTGFTEGLAYTYPDKMVGVGSSLMTVVVRSKSTDHLHNWNGTQNLDKSSVKFTDHFSDYC